MRRRCPLCLFSKAQPFFKDGLREYFLCPRCDLRFLDPGCRLSSADEEARYRLHRNDVAESGYRAFVKPLFDAVVASIPRGAAGLDFGCGTGPVLAAMLSDAGYDISLFDPYFHPELSCLARSYDFIVACEVVEHLFDPRAEFAKLKGLLAASGLLAISTSLWSPQTDFANWHYRRDPTHVVFYSERSFCWIRDAFGFATLSCRPQNEVLLWAGKE